MRKHIIIFLLIFCVTIGFATLSTVLDIKGNVNLAENIEDFRIELTNLIINDVDQVSLIANDKQSFTFTGSGNDSINYTITNYSYQYDANINLVCTPNDNITIEQVGDISAQSKVDKIITSTNTSEITCSINVEKISRSEYAEEMCPYKEGDIWNFNYNGGVQEFFIPCSGNYKLEVAGAVGGKAGKYSGGNGGYSMGEIYLIKDKPLYIVAGGNLYNGGGATRGGYGANGGGATHIALENRGELKNYVNNKSEIIIVAGGGGGGYNGSVQHGYGGAGGGLAGSKGSHGATGGSQTAGGSSGGSFGQGGSSGTYCSGGGGGYYGGGAGGSSGGAGGSGYIDGVKNGSTQSGVNSGAGYAKITYLGNQD